MKRELFEWCFLGALALTSLACSRVSGATGNDATRLHVLGLQGAGSNAENPSLDCLAVGALSEREKCFAVSSDFKNCPENDRRCYPYRMMYMLEQRLKESTDDFTLMASKRYASYEDSDQAYLEDLKRYVRESDSAWKRYRDAQCVLEQFAQGMSRQEISDLSEACRVEKTQARIADLEVLIDSVTLNGEAK